MKEKIMFFMCLCLLIFPNNGWTQMQENQYYPDGDLRIEWILDPEDDAIIRKEYYPKRMLKSTTRYKNEQIEGVYKEYGKNDNILVEINYAKTCYLSLI